MSTIKKDYTSIYSIKEFALTELAPKYFNMDDINQLNVGLMGYTTDLISNVTEDTFNGVATLLKEIFPNKARMPETIYNYAALFQEQDLFAYPSELGVLLFVNEDDVINLGTKKLSNYEFILDSDLIIDIEDKQFMLDYNIIITAKPYKNDYIFMAQYDLSYNNSISLIRNPYIKLKRIKYANTNYIALLLKVKQTNKIKFTEFIINNDKINLPTFTFDFNDQIANFEVFYKAPDMNTYAQLTKKMLGTTPIKEPFCYFRLKNSGELELSFTARDNYFQPKFNSELIVNIYTTTGSNGDFPQYTGTDVTVIPKSEVYDYNNKISLFAITQTESKGGRDVLELDALQNIVVEKFSTVGSYTNENDLQLYFSNFKYRYGNEILFVKKRDDALERLFSAFILLKDKNKDIYPTNTLHMHMVGTDFDLEYEQTNKYILKAGRLFTYKDNLLDTVIPVNGTNLKDDFSSLTDEFIYTNPFLMTVSKSPAIVGYYLNSINTKKVLEYSYVNNDSAVQFICNNLLVKRNALMGEDTYTLTVSLTPTLELDTDLVDPDTLEDLGLLKIKAVVEDESGYEFCYIDMALKSADTAAKIYTYEAILETDDYMTLSKKFRVFNMKDIISSVEEQKLIPMVNCKINIYAFYKYSDLNLAHKFNYMPDVVEYSMTNMYSTVDEKVNFISPLSIMRSQMQYKQVDDLNYYMKVFFVPMVKAQTLKNVEVYDEFMTNLFLQYDYMQSVLDRIINNYSIDLKFYNTFGRSKNFVAGEDNTLLNKVNCSITFKVAPTVGAVYADLVRDLRIFIKNYIENINTKGSNSIFISNLIRNIEENFVDVKYLKFVSINSYDSSIQTIENKTLDFNQMTKEERKNFVPEYLTLDIDEVYITIL